MDKNTGYGETPPKLKKRMRQRPAEGTRLDFSLEEGEKLKPIVEGDMRAPSTVTDGDLKQVARMMSSPVQHELAELGKGRELIKRVQSMPAIESESDKKMREMIVEGKKPSEKEGGGGFLEMFGLAGGRRRRRKKSRRKKRRKSKKRKSRRRRKKSRRRRSRRRRR